MGERLFLLQFRHRAGGQLNEAQTREEHFYCHPNSSREPGHKEKMTARLHYDLDGDGHKELLVHDYYGGSGGFGTLLIYSMGKRIFSRPVEGDPYLWDSGKQRPGLNPDAFPDLDGDGIRELVIMHRGVESGDFIHSQVDEAWWLDVYQWAGKTYVLASERFPAFYEDQLEFYLSSAKNVGLCSVYRKYISRAKKLAGLT